MSDGQLLLRWRWGVGALIFFAGNLIGWATHPNPVGLAVSLACMLVMWWAIPVWIARNARPEMPAAPWPDGKVWWNGGAWRTRGGWAQAGGSDFEWAYDPGSDVWRREERPVQTYGPQRLMIEQNRLLAEQNRLLGGGAPRPPDPSTLPPHGR